uniref:Uncharacterized protein n=1 Tax=Ciona savignyi TaxID=51511 RepID=H2YFW8_CIOSA
MPKHYPDDHKVQLNKSPDPAPFPAFLPLEIFDNTEFDCRTWEEWLGLGVEGNVRRPVPAKSLLPTEDRLDKGDPKDPNITYKWFNVGVLDYDKESDLWFVQKVDDQGRVLDTRGQPVVNGGVRKTGSRMGLPQQYWVPRIRVMFRAEDASIFAHRVAEAYRLRKKTEGLIRYNLYVDCMPHDDNVLSLESSSFENMTSRSINTPGLRSNDPVLLDCVAKLEQQVGLDFKRTMNKLTFDKVVSRNLKSFAYVTLPEPEPD